MNILITGGAGYLGSHLAFQLLERGHSVKILDCFLYGNRGISHIQNHPSSAILNGNICNILDIVQAVKETDVVVALAAIVGDPACNLNDEDTLNTNFESTKILVDACKYYNVRRIIFASSCSVYGSSGNRLNESSPVSPLSLYARTRIMSEKVILENSSKIETTILRFATLFGFSQRMRFDLVANIFSAHAIFNKKLTVHGGTQTRPLLHVSDAARCIACACESEIFGGIFNAGSSELNYRIIDIAEKIASYEPGCSVETIESEDERNYTVDFSKIEDTFGFHPDKGLEDGFSEIKNALQKKIIQNYRDDIFYNVKYLHK